MKKLTALLLTLSLLLACVPAGLAEPTKIVPNMSYTLPQNVIDGIVKLNEEVEGENPLTGLPMSDEPYTPISLVLDNSPEVYPHWGVAEADLFFQVPIRRDHAVRIVTVYSNQYPAQAGGARSARMTTFPIAVLFNAVAAWAGVAPVLEWDIQVMNWVEEWDYNKPIRYVDLLGKPYKERVDFLESPQNLSAHVDEIHQYLMGRERLKFEKRYFRFTDEPLTSGDDAKEISMLFAKWPDVNAKKAEREQHQGYNDTSNCTFTYDGDAGYIRTSKTGVYTERATGEEIHFANVVVLRSQIEWEGNYCYYNDHLRYCGEAEYFMNGKHFTGAWYRAGRKARLVLLDGDGNEVSLQRGKTWFVLGDDHVEVSYE